jgi:hypothetical protein
MNQKQKGKTRNEILVRVIIVPVFPKNAGTPK